MTKLRVAVIGAGHLGRIHTRLLKTQSEIDLVAVADPSPAAQQQIIDEFGVNVVSNYRKLIDQIDAAVIATPTRMHFEIAQELLNAKVHTLIEKPLTDSVTDANELVKTAKENGCVVQVGHVEQFNPAIKSALGLVGQPKFIQASRMSGYTFRSTDIGVVHDLMIHDIDIVLSLIQSELKYVSAVGARIVTNHVDIANARLEFEDGAIANVTASRVSAKRFRRIRVFGDACYLALNFEDQQIQISRPGKRPPDGSFAPIINSSIHVEPTQPLNSELAHFVDCVQKGRRPLVTGSDGLQALKVAYDVREKIEKSLHSVA